MWISNLNRLPNRVRLAFWGMNVPKECCLCSRHNETKDQLLICCEFSKEIWRLTFSRLSPSQHTLRTWYELLSWPSRSSQQAHALRRKISAQTTVFHLWKQRNNVLHNAQALPTQTIFKCIDHDICNIINSRRNKRHFGNLMSLWLRWIILSNFSSCYALLVVFFFAKGAMS